MSKPLPKSNFKWKRAMPTEEEILNKKENGKSGWILEVDLEYPREFHEKHDSFPLAPEKRISKKEWMSPYQRRHKRPGSETPGQQEAAADTARQKQLRRALQKSAVLFEAGHETETRAQGAGVRTRTLVEPYIRMNTDFRKKANSDFEKNFYKLMNNSVFGETMENLRNRVDIKIVRSNETDKIRKLIASPLCSRHILFSNHLAGVDMRKTKLVLNKPVYTGMTILDNSKILMYDFFYNHLKKQYGPRCELLYTGTDSLLLEIETDDVYKHMEANKHLFDTSDYPKDHPLHSNTNKKVLGKMKDECAGTPIAECVCLRLKMYSIVKADKQESKGCTKERCEETNSA